MCGPDPARDTRPGTLDRDTGPGTPDGRRTAMSLHSLLSVTIGVPNVGETAAYYTDFGLTPAGGGWFSTADAGRQLRLLPAPGRRLPELRGGAHDPDDRARPPATPAP